MQVVVLPHDDPASLSATFNNYFMTKIDAIREEFPGLIARLPDYFVHQLIQFLSQLV